MISISRSIAYKKNFKTILHTPGLKNKYKKQGRCFKLAWQQIHSVSSRKDPKSVLAAHGAK